MAEWEQRTTLDEQGYLEQGFWPVISQAADFVRRERVPVFVADSTAVRAFNGLARDIGDIDFVFPRSADAMVLTNSAVNELKPLYTERTEIDGRVAFFRMKLPSPVVYKGEKAFIIDFHFGGIVLKGTYRWRPTSERLFELAEWREVSDVLKTSRACLPVLPLEVTVALKLEKAVGKDVLDVLVALIYSTMNLERLAAEVRDRDKARGVIEEIRGDLSTQLSALSSVYHVDTSDQGIHAEERLQELLDHLST
jgi:hypothetical protein